MLDYARVKLEVANYVTASLVASMVNRSMLCGRLDYLKQRLTYRSEVWCQDDETRQMMMEDRLCDAASISELEQHERLRSVLHPRHQGRIKLVSNMSAALEFVQFAGMYGLHHSGMYAKRPNCYHALENAQYWRKYDAILCSYDFCHDDYFTRYDRYK